MLCSVRAMCSTVVMLASAPFTGYAQAPTQPYLVLFDWNKETLTDQARQIVEEAVENSARVHYSTIWVIGHADTSGTSPYNIRLSIKRANAVAEELVRQGLPKSAIRIAGVGDAHPYFPTGPGVRAAQNRRVQITIQ